MLFRICRVCTLLLLVGLACGWGCLGNNAYREGHPCSTDTDCISAGATLFCGKENLCVAEACGDGETRPCFNGTTGCDAEGKNCKGACKAGTQTCSGGFWGACTGQVLPKAETCNGEDDDCDGQIDNGAAAATEICTLSDPKIGTGAGGLTACVEKKPSCTIDAVALCGSSDQESCQNTPEIVFIKGSGKNFQMGTPDSTNILREDDEGGSKGPVQVSFGYNFGVSRTEITQKQFKAVMGYLPAGLAATGDDLPVHGVSWHEAAAYTVHLSQKHGLSACFTCLPAHDPSSGKVYTGTCTVASSFADEQLYALGCPGFRLPTEAEWEYAYRAQDGGGLYRDFYNGKMTDPTNRGDYDDTGLSQIAQYNQNAGGQPKKVKGLLPNDWQLFDMSGNIGEWVFDKYINSYASGNVANTNRIGPNTGSENVWRGGHYLSLPHEARGSKRNKLDPTKREVEITDGPNQGKKVGLGFRIARTLRK